MNEGVIWFLGLCFGLILGMLLMGFLESCIPGLGYNDAKNSKQECEKSLPRDQVCVPHYLPAGAK